MKQVKDRHGSEAEQAEELNENSRKTDIMSLLFSTVSLSLI